jgi:hypothetical protein
LVELQHTDCSSEQIFEVFVPNVGLLGASEQIPEQLEAFHSSLICLNQAGDRKGGCHLNGSSNYSMHIRAFSAMGTLDTKVQRVELGAAAHPYSMHKSLTHVDRLTVLRERWHRRIADQPRSSSASLRCVVGSHVPFAR